MTFRITNNKLLTGRLVTFTIVAAVGGSLLTVPTAQARDFDWLDSIRRAWSGKDRGGSSDKEKLQRIVTKGSEEINRRLGALARLNTLVAASTTLSPENKAALTSEIAASTTELNELKADLSASSSVKDARRIVQKIYSQYRIYALVRPKIHLVKLADGVLVTSSKLTALAQKLQSRITTAQEEGKDVSALMAKLDDMTTHTAEAQKIASQIELSAISIQPTYYSKNQKLLLGYNMQLKSAREHNRAAYADARQIVNQLKAL